MCMLPAGRFSLLVQTPCRTLSSRGRLPGPQRPHTVHPPVANSFRDLAARVPLCDFVCFTCLVLVGFSSLQYVVLLPVWLSSPRHYNACPYPRPLAFRNHCWRVSTNLFGRGGGKTPILCPYALNVFLAAATSFASSRFFWKLAAARVLRFASSRCGAQTRAWKVRARKVHARQNNSYEQSPHTIKTEI